MKIYVAGHRGMVGSAIVRAIEADENYTWIGATRSEVNLTDRRAVFDYLKLNAPDAVVIAAAKVGGILANNSSPVDFLSENLQIQTNLIDGSHAAGIQKLVFLGSSCVYPKFAEQPLSESSLLTGELEPTNEPYALAKIAGLKLVQAYRRQFGHKWISLMPTNLYGPGDNYDHLNSHVIPGVIVKLCNAKRENEPSVTLWGTGDPLREFLHVDDLASATLFAMKKFDGDVALNVGSGEECSIKDLAHTIKDALGYRGEIKWDTSKPDGTPRKLLDSSIISNMGWAPTITLKEGIAKTISQIPLKCQ